MAPTEPNVFEDDRIRIAWQPGVSQLGFALINKTDSSVRVLWDDASYVDVQGRTDRVMHQGIKFADRSASMPPTSIMHGATLDDVIAPVSNVYWRQGYGGGDVGGWQSRPLLTAAPAANSTIKVLLPIESNGKVTEYVFIFGVRQALATVAEIKIVRNTSEVAQCEFLGSLAAHPPYIWPGDDYRQLRAQAAPLGADTILVPGYRVGVVEGQAYRCSK